MKLYNAFKDNDKTETLETVYQIINKYDLSLSQEYGYDYYKCNSSEGLGEFNRRGFYDLRFDYNKNKNSDDYYHHMMLYVLIVYSFNNQIRFNHAGDFNLPVGKRDFNSKMEQKLSKFIDRIKSSNYTFICKNFKDIDLSNINKDGFLYADPPYLITCATYNEQNAWNEQCERDLLEFLDNAHSEGLRFALSNVLRSKGKENNILLTWLDTNKDKYKVVELDYNYANSNYQTKDKSGKTEEVLIVNY
jgi:DNA adenine methylase Dam